MDLYGRLGKEQLLRDLLVRPGSGEKTEHLTLTGRKCRDVRWLLRSQNKAGVGAVAFDNLQHVLECRAKLWDTRDLARKTLIEPKSEYEWIENASAHCLADTREDGIQ